MAILSIIGMVMVFVGWIWLMVVAYKSSGALWSTLIFFFSWIAGLIFCIMKKEGWMQLGLMILGFILIVLGGGASFSGSIG
jgi:hypothetical protein